MSSSGSNAAEKTSSKGGFKEWLESRNTCEAFWLCMLALFLARVFWVVGERLDPNSQLSREAVQRREARRLRRWEARMDENNRRLPVTSAGNTASPTTASRTSQDTTPTGASLPTSTRRVSSIVRRFLRPRAPRSAENPATAPSSELPASQTGSSLGTHIVGTNDGSEREGVQTDTAVNDGSEKEGVQTRAAMPADSSMALHGDMIRPNRQRAASDPDVAEVVGETAEVAIPLLEAGEFDRRKNVFADARAPSPSSLPRSPSNSSSLSDLDELRTNGRLGPEEFDRRRNVFGVARRGS